MAFTGARVKSVDHTPIYLRRLATEKDRAMERMGEWVRAKEASLTPVRTSAMANGWYWTTINRSNYPQHANAARAVAERRGLDILPEIEPRSGFVRNSNAVRYAAAVNDGSQGRAGLHIVEEVAQQAREKFPALLRWRLQNALGSEWGGGSDGGGEGEDGGGGGI